MDSLFDTTYINNMKLKNRFIRSATSENMCTVDGHITDKLFKLYKLLASGGLGMIITGSSAIFKYNNQKKKMLGIYNDSFIGELKELTDMVHYNRCKIAMEISQKNDISRQDEEYIIRSFGEAAFRVKESGFDAVEIKITNIKNDKFIFDVYREIRSRVGKNFNVFIKINCLDFEEDVRMLNDLGHICDILDKLGIDAIEIGNNKEYACKLAENENCNIISGGFNRSLECMNDILNDTCISYFSMSRPLICEPDLINKWLSGATTKSNCKSCNNCMIKNSIRCIHNI